MPMTGLFLLTVSNPQIFPHSQYHLPLQIHIPFEMPTETSTSPSLHVSFFFLQFLHVEITLLFVYLTT